MTRRSILIMLLLAAPSFAAEFPAFKVQEIDKTLKVGYGLRIVDLNADGKLDIVVADAARVIWFDPAQNWKLREIIDNAKAGVKADNVAIDVADINRDGKLDIALGADWQPSNTRTGGSLQWLRQGKTIDEWTVHPIAESIPTLHRIHFVENGGKLIVVPLRGERSTPAGGWMDAAVRLLSYSIPPDPAGKWEPQVLNDQLHNMHNVRPMNDGVLLTASSEGIGLFAKSWKQVHAGHPGDPKAGQGSGEVAAGLDKKQFRFIAAIEPMHGHQVVAYAVPSKTRTMIDDQLKAGHALWTADLDGDGIDEIVAGFRDPAGPNARPGVNLYKTSDLSKWTKHVLDDGGMACEDLACADLDADGDIDIVACGRATGNVRIYWNQRINPG